jgi:hypothetical protein
MPRHRIGHVVVLLPGHGLWKDREDSISGCGSNKTAKKKVENINSKKHKHQKTYTKSGHYDVTKEGGRRWLRISRWCFGPLRVHRGRGSVGPTGLSG